jgi:hypothetical protein
MITVNKNGNKYDIIGDIHGCADELKELLLKLGYDNARGFYAHPEGRKVIFLGNYIDRGPKIRKTLHIVKSMCENGTAEALLGNHEFNALCFWEINKDKGGYLRKHSLKNILQHSKSIKQFEDEEEELDHYLLWFMTLPLFIEKENLRAGHECWDQKIIEQVKRDLPGNRLTKIFLHRAVVKEYKEYREAQVLLKGIEMKLPKTHFIKDTDSGKKLEARIKWWVNPIGVSFGEYLINCPVEIKDQPVPLEILPTHDYYQSDIPLFIGHYILNEHPRLQTPKIACLDYGVEKGGELVAYRWDGEKQLNPKNLISVKKINKQSNLKAI